MYLAILHLPQFLSGYTSNSYNAGRATALAMLISFVLTFILVRSYTRIARVRDWRSASISGVHTHHLVFGLVIAFFSGAIEFALLPSNEIFRLILAVLFGGGAAMVLDEFALAVHLEDVYWENEGRKSVDAVIIGVIFGLLFLLHTAPFGHPKDLPRILFSVIQLVNLIFVLSAALKGKIYFAIFGVFIPVLALVGGIRLAEPDSIWARQFYDSNGEKLQQARERYAGYERVWRPRQELLRDILGGKPGRPLRKRR